MSAEFAVQGEYPNFRTLRAGARWNKKELARVRDTRRGLVTPAALPSGVTKHVLFGSDYSDNNGNVTLASLAGNLKFVIIRITGGLGNTKGVWLDQMAKPWLRELRAWVRTGEVMGAVYGFPVDDARVDLDVQLDVFLNTVGEFDGLVPMIDYELYGPAPDATCSPAELHYYSNGIGKELGFRRTQMLYSGGFYDETPYSGDIADFRAPITTMNAWYWTMREIERRREYYYEEVEGSGFWNRFGRWEPDFTQYGIGKGNEDLDACRRSEEWMMRLPQKIAA